MKVRITLFTFFFMFLFSLCAYGIGEEGDSILNIEKASKKIQQESGYMQEVNFKAIVDNFKRQGFSGKSMKDFFKILSKSLFKEIIGNSRLMIELIFIGIFCALLQNIQNSFGEGNVSKIAYYICFLLMVVLILKSFMLSVEIGRKTIDSMIEFNNALVPTLIFLLASMGGITSAASLDPVMLLVIKLSSDVIRDFVLPMCIFSVVLNIVDSLGSDIKITKLASLIKQVNLWVLGIIMTFFIGVITIRSSTSAAIDQVTLKTAKYAVDNFVPIVGKCLSDAISTVAGYTLVLKNAVSAAGLIFMIFICVVPLVKIIILALIYKFTGAAMEPIVDGRVSDCLSKVGDSLTIVIVIKNITPTQRTLAKTIVANTGRLVVLGG